MEPSTISGKCQIWDSCIATGRITLRLAVRPPFAKGDEHWGAGRRRRVNIGNKEDMAAVSEDGQLAAKALEKSITKIQNQQIDVQSMEQIDVKNVPLSSKVMLEKEDYQTLVTAAQKYVVQVKKES